MMREGSSKEKDLDSKRKKVLQVTLESNDEESEYCLSEFCFMSIEEEKDDDFERAFEEQYVEPIYMAKKNKELKEQLEATTMENYDFRGELRSKVEELT